MDALRSSGSADCLSVVLPLDTRVSYITAAELLGGDLGFEECTIPIEGSRPARCPNVCAITSIFAKKPTLCLSVQQMHTPVMLNIDNVT